MIKVYVRDSVGENVGRLGEFCIEDIHKLPDLFKAFPTFTDEEAEFSDAQFVVDENGTHFEIVVQ